MKATVRCPGSCGELVQGTSAGINFLVTCPINLYSQVSVDLSSGGIPAVRAGEKTREAVKRMLDHLGVPSEDFLLSVASDLPVGKGMASSSADISSACLAAALAAGRQVDAGTICQIALEIEPTDGIFLPGITMIDHVTGKLCHSMGEPPEITIAVFDAGGEVDTIHFNQRTDLAELNSLKEADVKRALKLVEQGLLTGNSALVGEGATLSARANQPILYKPSLEKIIAISREYGAIGVNAAHSGTVLGVLFDSGADADIEGCVRAVCRECADSHFFKIVRMVSGGLEVVEVR